MTSALARGGISSDEYWRRLEAAYAITRVAPAQDGNFLCQDRNHTHFSIPDPDEQPSDEGRLEMLEFVMSDLASFALGY